jgi:hypothetical protein
MGSILEPQAPASAGARPRHGRIVGVVGAELMARSRVMALAVPLGWRVRDVRTEAEARGVDLLLLDLNREPGLRLALLDQARSTRPQLPAICFGAHVEAGSWAPEARRLGAICCANSSLSRVLRRHLSPVPG